jgi:hypothetical protein
MGITDTQPHQHAKQGNATQELPHLLHIIPNISKLPSHFLSPLANTFSLSRTPCDVSEMFENKLITIN